MKKYQTNILEKHFQEIGSIVFDMSPASGYMGAKYFQEFGQKYMPVLCQEYMLFFCLPLSNQPRLNTQQQGRARGGGGAPHRGRAPLLLCAEEVEPWLTAQWQTEK